MSRRGRSAGLRQPVACLARVLEAIKQMQEDLEDMVSGERKEGKRSADEEKTLRVWECGRCRRRVLWVDHGGGGRASSDDKYHPRAHAIP